MSRTDIDPVAPDGAVDAPAPPPPADRVAQRISGLEYALCSLIVLFGASIRATGLTSGDLWADDAWITLPVRTGIRQALRLDVSTPLFVLVLRQWASFDTGSTAFIQLLPLVASVLTIGAVWWLVRTVGGSMWTRVIVTTLAAIAPASVEFSVRVKEYSTEMLLGTLLLIAVAKAVQRPTPRRTAVLLVVCVAACLTSGTLVLFVAGVLAAFVIQGLRTQRRRDPWWIGAVAGVVVAMGATYLAFYDHLPPALRSYWSAYEFGPANRMPWTHTIGIMGMGIAHGFVGAPSQVGPIPYEIALSTAQFSIAIAIAVAVLVAVVALVAAVVWIARREVSQASTAGIASVAVLVLAAGAAFTGHVPLGGGRTDLWWYPAMWCVIAIVLERVLRALAPTARRAPMHAARAATAAVVVVIAALAVPFGVHFRAWYPGEDVRALLTEHRAEIRPTDWIALSRYNTFAYALYGLGPYHIAYDTQKVHTNQGWSVVVDKHNVSHLLSHSPRSLCSHTKRIWWIGINASITDPSGYHWTGARGAAPDPVDSRFLHHLGPGWVASSAITGDGVNAVLFTHPGACS